MFTSFINVFDFESEVVAPGFGKTGETPTGFETFGIGGGVGEVKLFIRLPEPCWKEDVPGKPGGI